jgi:hypothetical protein
LFSFVSQIDLSVKLFLTSLLAFVPAEQQMWSALIVVAAFIIFTLLTTPFVRHRDDILGLCAQTEILLVLLTGLVIQQNTQNERSSEPGSLNDILVAVMLFGITFLVLLLFLYYLALFVKEQAKLALWKATKQTATSKQLLLEGSSDDTSTFAATTPTGSLRLQPVEQSPPD